MVNYRTYYRTYLPSFSINDCLEYGSEWRCRVFNNVRTTLPILKSHCLPIRSRYVFKMYLTSLTQKSIFSRVPPILKTLTQNAFFCCESNSRCVLITLRVVTVTACSRRLLSKLWFITTFQNMPSLIYILYIWTFS